jgi:pectin methylesterase-like acyl-CoA thioesterase
MHVYNVLVNRAPSHRYVIQVKEGVYEEYVTITKTMKNVTLLGDGSKKSIVTGKKSFADGITTFKTATFSKDDDDDGPPILNLLDATTDAP